MNKLDNLNERQLQIYEFIKSFAAEYGYPPSVREIAQGVNLASPSTVHAHLKTLEEHQLIKRNSHTSRSIELVDEENVLGNSEAAHVSMDLAHNTISLPVVGQVAAGTPILAEQNIEDRFSLPAHIAGDASSFVLRVRGESMINAGIYDGDYIVVEEEKAPHNGEIVVALIDDSATVKTFYKEQNRIRLQPENDSMEPIYAENPQIIGKVTALIRSF